VLEALPSNNTALSLRWRNQGACPPSFMRAAGNPQTLRACKAQATVPHWTERRVEGADELDFDHVLSKLSKSSA